MGRINTQCPLLSENQMVSCLKKKIGVNNFLDRKKKRLDKAFGPAFQVK